MSDLLEETLKDVLKNLDQPFLSVVDGDRICSLMLDMLTRIQFLEAALKHQTKPPAEPSRSAGDHMGHERD